VRESVSEKSPFRRLSIVTLPLPYCEEELRKVKVTALDPALTGMPRCGE